MRAALVFVQILDRVFLSLWETVMTEWIGDAAELYNLARHGADGARLLDLKLGELLSEYCPNARVYDKGCGSGRFMVDALQLGAMSVFGMDNNPDMVNLAKNALRDFGYIDCEGAVKVGDVTSTLDWKGDAFTLCLSINVGCNVKNLLKMFQEAYRVLARGAHMIVTLPANLNLLFLRYGADSSELRSQCNEELLRTGDPFSLKHLGDVFRGTVIKYEQSYRLVRPDESVPNGTEIWRKLAGLGDNPGLVVPNVWWPESAYIEAAERSNFKLINDYHGRFRCGNDLMEWNRKVPDTDKISVMACQHDVFRILFFRKP